MTRRAFSAAVLSASLLTFSNGSAPASADPTRAPADRALWREFVELLRTGLFPNGKIRPYREELREPVAGFLRTMRAGADWEEWEREPDLHRVGDRLHALIPLTFGGETNDYCFSFFLDDGAWYFQHVEAIVLRLDRIGEPPVSEFPDLPEPTKAWMREEIRVSREVWLYNALAGEKVRDAARDYFRDGAGYALAARSWVPFVSPPRAFVLYLCWEQSRLRGGEAVLERLDDEGARVRLSPITFLLYENTAHLKQMISLEEYRGLFEFRWRDRAAAAGWAIDFAYDGPACVMRLRRSGEEPR